MSSTEEILIADSRIVKTIQQLRKSKNNYNQKEIERSNDQEIKMTKTDKSNKQFERKENQKYHSNKVNIKIFEQSGNDKSKILIDKEKNDYQKKITSKESIDKYKQMCILIIKQDEEIRQILDELKIKELEEMNKLIDDYMFNDSIFQLRLEMFLIQKNGNTKALKSMFFKNEIFQVLKLKRVDSQYNGLIRRVSKGIEDIEEKIKGFSL